MLNEFTISPAICKPTVVYELTNVVGPDAGDYSGLANGWLYPGNSNGSLGLTANLADFVSNALPEGVYTFTVTAKGLGSQSQTTDFTWTLDYLCNNRACPTVAPVTYKITETTANIDFSSLEVSGCTLNWDFSISPTPASTGFVTQPGTGPSLEVFWDTDLIPASEFGTADNPFVSQYTVTVTGTNSDAYSISCPVTLTVDTPCDSITFSDPGQIDLSDTYTGVE